MPYLKALTGRYVASVSNPLRTGSLTNTESITIGHARSLAALQRLSTTAVVNGVQREGLLWPMQRSGYVTSMQGSMGLTMVNIDGLKIREAKDYVCKRCGKAMDGEEMMRHRHD